jgi:flagellar motor switch protein FliM
MADDAHNEAEQNEPENPPEDAVDASGMDASAEATSANITPEPAPASTPAASSEATESEDSGLSELLGQDDIDSLLQQFSAESEADEDKDALDAGERKAAEEKNKGIVFAYPRKSNAEPVKVEPYDFRNPAFLGEMEMRRLRLMHEDFIRFLEARITLFLRSDFSLKMTHLSTKSYEQSVSEVENPTHLALFRMPPMSGVGFIEMSPNVALTIASSILGGKGHAPRIERYLTQIEIDLIEEFLGVVLEEWARCWESDKESFEPNIVGHEIVANVLQICEHDTVMFSLMMDASLRGAVGRLGICVPLHMIEEPVRQLNVKRMQDGLKKERKVRTWRPMYAEIPVEGEAVFSLGKYPVSEVLTWQVGTVVPFEESVLENVALKLANIPLFQGKAGIDNDNRAVQIVGKIQKKEDPIWQMKT